MNPIYDDKLREREGDRLREHPETRFSDDQQVLDLNEATRELLSEPPSVSEAQGHKQKALFRHGPMTIGLWVFEPDGCLPDHVLDGDVMIQVLEGQMRVSTDHGEQELKPGQVMVIGPNIRHDLRALQPSRVLMTFCYEKWGQEPCEAPEQGH